MLCLGGWLANIECLCDWIASEYLEQCGLSRAVITHHGDAGLSRNLQVNPRQQHPPANTTTAAAITTTTITTTVIITAAATAITITTTTTTAAAGAVATGHIL